MAKLFEPPQYIAVEGPIRVGKSTLANIIADRLNAQRVIEPEDNPFLRPFYEAGRGIQGPVSLNDPTVWATAPPGWGPDSPKARFSRLLFEKDKIFAYINL